jgi:hypothetical protein
MSSQEENVDISLELFITKRHFAKHALSNQIVEKIIARGMVWVGDFFLEVSDHFLDINFKLRKGPLNVPEPKKSIL